MKNIFKKKRRMSNALKRRFVKDYNLPINIVDEPYFEYYRKLYDWFPNKTYNEILESIDKDHGSDNAFLECYAEVRDNVITTIENSEPYKKFNNCDMSKYSIPKTFNVGDMDIYTQNTVGKKFFSIDLTKANFQALKFVDPNIVQNADTYKDLIYSFTIFPYIAESKYTRQVIFGKLNPKRTISVEKYIMYMIHNYIIEDFNEIFNKIKLVAFKSDELIFEVPYDVNITNDERLSIIFGIKNNLNIDVHCEYFKIGIIETKNSNNISVNAFIRTNLNDGTAILKNASMIYYPQFYKLWKHKRINRKDLVFMNEGQPARFISPLKLIRIVE